MSKTLLVAKREYVENLRTKTFWIGIIAFPVIIALSIFVAKLLDRSKDVRSYAVLDRSAGQWLSAEVERRGAQRDLQRILTTSVDTEKAAPPQTPAELRAAFVAARDRAADTPALAELMTIFVELDDAELKELLAAGEEQRLPAGVLTRNFAKFSGWVERHGAKDLRAISSSLDLTRYRKVDAGSNGEEPDAVEERLRKRLKDGELFAYFVIGADPVAGTEGSRYVSNNLTDDDLRQWYAGLATEAVRERRIAKMQLDPEEARLLRADFSFREKKVSETGEEEDVKGADKGSKFAPIAFVYLLWIAVFSIAQMLLTNTVEEKATRIIEVLLSSVSPRQLMHGKIWGIAATGLTMVGSWVVFAVVGVKLYAATVVNAKIDILAIVGDPLYLASFVVYFLAGYLLFAAILVAIGSVCNSLKEAQNLMQPVMILLIVPLLAMMFVVQDPNGTVARIMTYVPLYTPFLMMNRAGGPPPTWEYVATSILIVVSVLFAFWAAGKVFRIGILLTGKPPKLREILGWLRR